MNKLSIERIAALKHILSGFIDGYDTVDDRENFEAMRDSLSALDELIALKGDQVPVAMVDERQGSGGFCLTQHGRKLNLQHGTELFTAPQKPGRLRQIGSIDHDGGEYGEYFVEFTDSASIGQAVYVIDAAIEAASGSVKDSE